MRASATADTFSIHIQRREGGRLVPCVLTLEKGSGIVVSEVCNRAAPAGGAAGVVAAVEALGIQANLQMGPDGAVVNILSGNIPVSTQQELDFFQMDRPCEFPGCEALRTQYQEDLGKLPEGCPMCEYGALMRKYIEVMRNLRA